MARPSTYLGFLGTAQPLGLRRVGPAAVLSGSRKTLGTGTEGWGGEGTQMPLS